jgi:hypothetical protein
MRVPRHGIGQLSLAHHHLADIDPLEVCALVIGCARVTR